MTREEFNAKHEELCKRRDDVFREIIALREEYRTKDVPYPIGAKLEVSYNLPNGKQVTKFGIVKDYEINFDGYLRPVLAPIRKDGNPCKKGQVFIEWWANVKVIVK